MSWDLALSRDQDLVFGPNRDLQYVDSTALINQRIITRLLIVRASWLFDEDGTLGSRLDLLLSESPERGEADAESLIREALDPIRNEIQIEDVIITPVPLNRLEVVINYLWLTPDTVPLSQQLSQLVVILP